jgi:NADPH2:quinone reductase
MQHDGIPDESIRAILSRAAGPAETLTLERVVAPIPGPREVRVAVKACAVNFPDVLVIQDRYQVRPARPFSPGAEISGVIDAIGDEVDTAAVGDRVLAQPGIGGLAEKLVVSASRLTPMPERLGFVDGAAMVVTYGTTYYALKRCAALAAGETLFVLGAAGGVGIAAVELGKAMGARVLAAVSSEAKASFVRSRGADEVIIYPRDMTGAGDGKMLTRRFKDLCGPDGAHVVYDAIGGDYAEPALRTVGWRGRYLVVGFAAGIPSVPLNLALLNGRQILGVFWGESVRRDFAAYRHDVDELFQMYFSGRIRPTVSETFPLERAAEAIGRLENREAVGKLVVTMD